MFVLLPIVMLIADCRWRCAGRLSIPSAAELKAQSEATQQVATADVAPKVVQTAASATAAAPKQKAKPTVTVVEPEQVRRKGKKRARVAAAA